MTPSRRSISDHPSAVLPEGGREGEKKKSSDRERFAARDLRAPVARATLNGKPPETDESESRNVMWQTENIVGRDARHNTGRNRVETPSKHLNEVVKEQIADEEERWSRADSLQITLSQ